MSIARALWGDPKAISILHALNPDMGPAPHRLVPGTRLLVKEPPVAEITFVKPAVDTRPAGGTAWQPAQVGLDLFRRDEVATRHRAAAEVTFFDASRLELRENVLVVIYGGAGTPPPGNAPLRKSGAVELVQGELRLSLAELRNEPLDLRTPAAQVAARSRDTSVAVDREATSRVSVLDGSALVRAQGSSVKVAEGQGTRVTKGRPPEPPRPLPEAPRWAREGRDVRVFVEGRGADAPLAWTPVQTAASYRLELARDEAFVDRVREESVPADPSPSAVVRVLEPGRYFARVRAIDVAGLLGRPSEPRRLDVLQVKVERGAFEPGGARGEGEVRIAVEGDEDLEVTLDGAPARFPLTVATVGSHTVRLSPRGGVGGDDRMAVEVTAVPPPAVDALPGLDTALGTPASLVESDPLPSPFLPTPALRAEVRFQVDGDAADTGREPGGRLDLRLDARLTGRVALGFAVSGRSALADDLATPFRRAAVRASARLAVARTATAAVVLGLEGSVPLVDFPEPLGAPRLRPSVALGLRLGSQALSTAHGYGLVLRSGAGGTYDAAHAVFWEPGGPLRLSAEVHGVSGPVPGGRTVVAWAMGAGVRLRLPDGWEAGLGGRAGIAGDGRDVWGRWAALFTFGRDVAAGR
ncbi:MAG TPA: FecR domain-containing protein [Anaeromyxobacteraceae bacterium]|nr:FecR domain-containing protein [Anaeromyxobacteraceae bacterium]